MVTYSTTAEEVNNMTQVITNEKVDVRNAVELFQNLPEEERIRVEGIIVGLTLAREQPRPAERQEGA